MKKVLVIVWILALSNVGCKDFLNLVPKNKKIVANVEDVKTEMLMYLGSITYSVGKILQPSYGSSSFRFPLYNDVATRLALYEDDIDMSYYSEHSDIDERSVGVY